MIRKLLIFILSLHLLFATTSVSADERQELVVPLVGSLLSIVITALAAASYSPTPTHASNTMDGVIMMASFPSEKTCMVGRFASWDKGFQSVFTADLVLGAAMGVSAYHMMNSHGGRKEALVWVLTAGFIVQAVFDGIVMITSPGYFLSNDYAYEGCGLNMGVDEYEELKKNYFYNIDRSYTRSGVAAYAGLKAISLLTNVAAAVWLPCAYFGR